MQRKTKFKIIFYSIGFISFALLPYVLTQNSADDTQRFAPLPSYNTSDSAHPFLSRLKGAASRLFSWGKQDPQSDAQQAVNAIDADTAAALNKATTNEVLASLTPAKKSTTQTKTLAAAGSPEAQAAAATAEEQQAAAEEAQAEQAKNAALFAAAPSAAYAGTSPSSPRANALNAQGRNQNYSGAYNNLPRGSKSGSLADLIAQNDARLVQMNLFSPANARAAIRRSRAAGKNKGSYKARFAKASNALKNAAISRARAKTYTYGYAGTPAAAITINSPEVQREMMLQTQELNSIFDQQLTLAIQETEMNHNERVNDLETLMSLPEVVVIPPPTTPEDTETSNPVANAPVINKQEGENGDKDNDSTKSPIKTKPAYWHDDENNKNSSLPPSEGNDSLLEVENDPLFEKEDTSHGPVIFVLDNNSYSPQTTSDEQPVTEIYQRCKDKSCWYVANKPTKFNDVFPLSNVLGGPIIGDPLNKRPLYQKPIGADRPQIKGPNTMPENLSDKANYLPYNDDDIVSMLNLGHPIFVGNLTTAKKMLGFIDPNDPKPALLKIYPNPFSEEVGDENANPSQGNNIGKEKQTTSFANLPEEQIPQAVQAAFEGPLEIMDAKAAADEDAANTVIVTMQTKEALNNKK